MAQNIAAIVPSPGAQPVLSSRPIPQPGPGELVVRNHAVAANPADYKVQDYGIYISQYPNVLGSDVSGVVESVGAGVTRFREGDRVLGFALVLAPGNRADEGAFQTYTVLREQATARIPAAVSFEEAAAVPMGIATAASGLFVHGGGLELPSVDGGVEKKPYRGCGFALWGAASSVGAMTLQVARDLGFAVYATASPRHHSYLEGLGATQLWDYRDPDVVRKVVEVARDNGTPIAFGFDAVGFGDGSIKVAEMIAQSSSNGGKMAYTVDPPKDEDLPAGVEAMACLAFAIFVQAEDITRFLFHEWLPVAMAQGRIKAAPEIEVVPGGLEATWKCWDRLKAGVSGKKLVIKIE